MKVEACLDFVKENPKLKWMFISTNLLDLQKVEWDYIADDNSTEVPVISYESIPAKSSIYLIGVNNKETTYTITFNKGKYTLNAENGQHALKIASFSSMYLKKFTGILEYKFYGDILISILPV